MRTEVNMSQQFGTVHRVEQLGPSMIRIVFGGPGLDDFEPTEYTDEYVNARFVPDGASYDVPFEDDDLNGVDAALRPKSRRYTVRRWDVVRRLLTIDFVAHGDEGHAGRWAQQAQIGDRLQMTGPGGGYRPNPNADWHLMAGDESALPAIAAAIEALDSDAKATAILLVDGPENELPIERPASVDVRWLYRCTAADPESLLLDEVQSVTWLDGSVDVFVHGEAAEVRLVRKHLFSAVGIDQDAASISPYWRRGKTDEAWREVKRNWLDQQASDT